MEWSIVSFTKFLFFTWASFGLDAIWLWFQFLIVCSAHQIPHFECMSEKFAGDLEDGLLDLEMGKLT